MMAAQTDNPDRSDGDGAVDLGPDQADVLELTIAHAAKLSRCVLLDAPVAVGAPTAFNRHPKAV